MLIREMIGLFYVGLKREVNESKRKKEWLRRKGLVILAESNYVPVESEAFGSKCELVLRNSRRE